MLYLNRMTYVARCSLYAIGVMFVAATLAAFLGGCAGKLKLPDLGSVSDIVDTATDKHEYKTQVKIEIKTDLESIPVVDMSPGIIMPPIIPLPTNTPFADPGQPTPVITPIPTIAKPTAPPLEPRPTAKPTMPPVIPPGDSDYSVSVVGIPVMTDENKDQLNKQYLFCLQSGQDRIGVFHRYLQPDWPHGEWWPVYRVEYYRGCDQIAEVPLADMEPMPGTSGSFLIDVEGDGVMVTLGDNSEALSVAGVPQSGWKLVSGCDGWFESEAEAAMTSKDSARGRLGNLIPSILR